MDVYSWFRRSLSSSRRNSTSSAAAADKSGGVKDDEIHLYGLTDQLIEFVKSFSLDTFKNFSLQDEEGDSNGDETSANVRKDLSEWQERHAMLVLSKVKELSQLRFRLCPRYLKEREFWRIYFALVKSYIAKYELHAIQLAKLKEMRLENGTRKDVNTYEVEMSETKQAKSVVRADSLEHD
ncbi:hypothetical protein M9H77_01204 [Catharanthus roseus]|uniref:Uncharacterized protein n=1 Tax=Catharanthus roseus TaxID=4058 RepID=A0ACC0C549_CATRO|nr:hypothetical protein M9H77_01204 [Catharanthus roseus]